MADWKDGDARAPVGSGRRRSDRHHAKNVGEVYTHYAKMQAGRCAPSRRSSRPVSEIAVKEECMLASLVGIRLSGVNSQPSIGTGQSGGKESHRRY
jgi:hypothetical protein